MFQARICAIVGFVMLSAASVDAGEALLSVEGRLGGDSNVYRESRNEVDDGYFEIAPRFRIRERREELNYDFSYSPIHETYFDTDGIDGWDHGLRGEVSWRVTPLDAIGVNGSFSQNRRVRQNFDSAAAGTEPFAVESDRERIRRSLAAISYTRQLTRVLSARVDVSFQDFDFNSDRNVDSRSYGGSVAGNYAYSQRTVFGIHASGRYRENRGVGLQPSSESEVGSVAATISHEFMEGLDFSLQIGPSFIRTDEDDRTGITRPLYDIISEGPTSGLARVIETNAPRTICLTAGIQAFDLCPFASYGVAPPANPLVTLAAPANAAGSSDTDVSFFAELRVVKQWQRMSAEFSYTRSESASSGVGSSQIVDSIVGQYMIGEDRLWNVKLRGEWSLRSVVSDVTQSVIVATPGPALDAQFSFAEATALTSFTTQNAGSSEETLWRVTLSGERSLTRQIKLLSRVQFNQYDRDNGVGSAKTTSVFGYIGIRYQFDPLVF